MRLISALVGAYLFSSFHAFKTSASEVFVIDARANVSYQGISTDGVDSFLNIHYGEDTSGSGRFAPPSPFVPAPNSVVNATTKGAACPQPMVPFPGLNGLLDNVTDISEDCLTLRVARPSSITEGQKLPVMIWIYGGMLRFSPILLIYNLSIDISIGGYSFGQAYDSTYQPDQLVLDSVANGNSVIFVAMNYRLGSECCKLRSRVYVANLCPSFWVCK